MFDKLIAECIAKGDKPLRAGMKIPTDSPALDFEEVLKLFVRYIEDGNPPIKQFYIRQYDNGLDVQYDRCDFEKLYLRKAYPHLFAN